MLLLLVATRGSLITCRSDLLANCTCVNHGSITDGGTLCILDSVLGHFIEDCVYCYILHRIKPLVMRCFGMQAKVDRKTTATATAREIASNSVVRLPVSPTIALSSLVQSERDIIVAFPAVSTLVRQTSAHGS